MLEIENRELFGKVIADSLSTVEQTVEDAQTKKRWINAISKAAAEIKQNGVFMTWQDDSQSLLIWSQKSNHIYSANGSCQCRAFAEKSPCFHRAAARLVRLYLEAENNPAPVEAANEAPYPKPPTYRPAERVGKVRIN